MKCIKGRYTGSVVVLHEKVELAPGAEVEVWVPEVEEASAPVLLDALDRAAVSEAPSVEEVADLVHHAPTGL